MLIIASFEETSNNVVVFKLKRYNGDVSDELVDDGEPVVGSNLSSFRSAVYPQHNANHELVNTDNPLDGDRMLDFLKTVDIHLLEETWFLERRQAMQSCCGSACSRGITSSGPSSTFIHRCFGCNCVLVSVRCCDALLVTHIAWVHPVPFPTLKMFDLFIQVVEV